MKLENPSHSKYGQSSNRVYVILQGGIHGSSKRRDLKCFTVYETTPEELKEFIIQKLKEESELKHVKKRRPEFWKYHADRTKHGENDGIVGTIYPSPSFSSCKMVMNKECSTWNVNITKHVNYIVQLTFVAWMIIKLETTMLLIVQQDVIEIWRNKCGV